MGFDIAKYQIYPNTLGCKGGVEVCVGTVVVAGRPPVRGLVCRAMVGDPVSSWRGMIATATDAKIATSAQCKVRLVRTGWGEAKR